MKYVNVCVGLIKGGYSADYLKPTKQYQYNLIDNYSRYLPQAFMLSWMLARTYEYPYLYHFNSVNM